MNTEKQQRAAAAAFARKWEGRGYEKGESQTFWIELLTEIFGVESPSTFITFEQQAQRYSAVLPYSERPRWIVTCNFAEFDVYDMENPKGEPSPILLKDRERECVPCVVA